MLILVELAWTVVVSLLFLLVLGDPRRHGDPLIAWHLWALAAVGIAAEGTLLTVGLGVAPPLWLFAVVYAGQAGVVTWRLVLMAQGRRRELLGWWHRRLGGIMTRKFLLKMLERAVRAGAWAALAVKGIVDPAVPEWSMTLLWGLKIFLGAALLSLLTSLAASQWGDHDSPSLLPPLER